MNERNQNKEKRMCVSHTSFVRLVVERGKERKKEGNIPHCETVRKIHATTFSTPSLPIRLTSPNISTIWWASAFPAKMFQSEYDHVYLAEKTRFLRLILILRETSTDKTRLRQTEVLELHKTQSSRRILAKKTITPLRLITNWPQTSWEKSFVLLFAEI